ncbi:MAG: toxic anion resistance protein [Clostridia bacterium]|nr:toxic anion resistance protein [Clostridia bacterium]
MDEMKVPVLSLNTDSNVMAALDQAVAQLEAPDMPSAPAMDAAVAAALDDTFTQEEREEIERFAGTIDVTNPDHVMLYGADAQKKVSSFADTILNSVKNTDSGEVGDILTNLITELKGFEGVAEKPRGLRRLFTSAKRRMAAIQSRYDVVSANVETIAGSLEQHQVQLLKDVAMFNQLYEKNLEYFRELSMYIEAGEIRLKQVREKDLAELKAKAEATADTMDAQAAKDLADQCDRFEKKLYDLKLTRQVALQMAPQIRMLQNNNALLVERIQSTLVNTLPLWKNQMVLAIGLQHSQQAMKAQKAVTDATNDLLKKNAETLKIGTLETAKEAERGIIDLETLVKTNQDLIDTISEVQRIQSEGRAKRQEAEKTLRAMENELKRKMLNN